MKDKTFIKCVDTQQPVETTFGWHEQQGAFERLTPPWMKLKNIIKSGNGIETGAGVNMEICFGKIAVPMKAFHVGYEKNRFFRDRLTGGPFSRWEHTHSFSTVGSKYSSEGCTVKEPDMRDKKRDTGISFSISRGTSRLEDRIDYALPFHIPDSWNRFIEAELFKLFNYRHTVMLNDFERHREYEIRSGGTKPLVVLISGASGPVGNALIPFLTTGGHKVIKLVRKLSPGINTGTRKKAVTSNPAESAVTERIWNPYKDELNLEGIGKINVVINLNGYHIGSTKWTDQTKEIIVQSRNLSTTLLADRISSMPEDQRPELFISASATGFYGDCGDSCLNENSCSGDLFISQVCQDWENCAEKAQSAGIRTVFARMGVVLTPAGGALERLLPGFMAGCGAKIGTGKQYMSWISMDDLVYAIHRIIFDRALEGAVNLISPNPVTNEEFTETLAGVLSRPAPFTLPAALIRAIWGEMGEEVLLASTRVFPDMLMESGFVFTHPTLESALRHLLGRHKA